VGPRAGLDRCGKSPPPSGFDPRPVQPVASRYTDYATRPTFLHSRCVLFVYLESRAGYDGGFDFFPTVLFQTVFAPMKYSELRPKYAR
jgi:hypothetical protein